MHVATFWFLWAYNQLTNFLNCVSHKLKKLYAALYENNVYIFFKDLDYPVLESMTNVESSKSALPQWKYIIDQYQFFEWYPGGTTTVQNCLSSHSLPYLSMEILDGEEVIYDLTDFIEYARVYNSTDEETSPSIQQIVTAWMLDARTVLNPRRGFKLRYIDTNGDTVCLPLYDSVTGETAVELDAEIDAEIVAEPVVEPVAEPDAEPVVEPVAVD